MGKKDATGGTSPALRTDAENRPLIAPPPTPKIAIACWQTPDAMQMVGQNNHRHYFEGPSCLGRPDRITQQADLVRKQRTAPVLQADSKEYGRAGNAGSNVMWHQPSLHQSGLTHPYTVSGQIPPTSPHPLSESPIHPMFCLANVYLFRPTVSLTRRRSNSDRPRHAIAQRGWNTTFRRLRNGYWHRKMV